MVKHNFEENGKMNTLINDNESLQKRLNELRKWKEPECDLLFALIDDLLLIDYNVHLTSTQLDKIRKMVKTFQQKDLNSSNTPFDATLVKLVFSINSELFAAVFEKHEVSAEDLFANFEPHEIVAQSERIIFHWVTIGGNYIGSLFD